MALYAFEIIERAGSRHDGRSLPPTRITTELPDREAARVFAIDMAERVLADQDGLDGRRRSVIAIMDEDGDVLDTIHSGCF